MLLKKALIASTCFALLPAAVFAQSQPVRTAEIFQGQISITQHTAFDLVVRLDRPAKVAGEAVADQVFIFRSEVPVPAGIAKLDGAARIIVRPDGLLIFADGHPALALRTGPAELAFVSSASEAHVLDGYQLSRFQSTSESYLDSAIAREIAPTNRTSLSGSELRSSFAALLAIEEGDCTSGGPGAETCTISGPAGKCDATCNPGYDACCNDGSCSCQAAN